MFPLTVFFLLVETLANLRIFVAQYCVFLAKYFLSAIFGREIRPSGQFGKDGWCARKLFSSFWNCARENRLVRGKTLKAKMAAQSARGAKILRIPISLITTPLCSYLVMLSARESKIKWRFAPYPYLTNSSHWYLSHDSKLSWKCNLVDDAEWNYTTYCHLYHGWRKGSSV